jgi:type IV pilus assembly protein PilV
LFLIGAGTHSMQSHTQGFSLIEVLIALAVLSIGLLGLADLHTTTLRVNDGAYLRTQANVLAYNIIDRMRANASSAVNGDYNIGFGDSVTTQQCTGPDSACTPAELAEADLYAWTSALRDSSNGLPRGQGSVQTSTTANGLTEIKVTIRWSDAEQSASQNKQQPELTVETAL